MEEEESEQLLTVFGEQASHAVVCPNISTRDFVRNANSWAILQTDPFRNSEGRTQIFMFQ